MFSVRFSARTGQAGVPQLNGYVGRGAIQMYEAPWCKDRASFSQKQSLERTLPSTYEPTGPCDFSQPLGCSRFFRNNPWTLQDKVLLCKRSFVRRQESSCSLACLRGSRVCRRLPSKAQGLRESQDLAWLWKNFSLSNSTHTHSKFCLETVSDTGNSFGRSGCGRHSILSDFIQFGLGKKTK